MTWDIPQFKALVDGLCDPSQENQGHEPFLILCDAFQEAEDNRHRSLRNYISKWVKHYRRYRTANEKDLKREWRECKEYTLSITDVHPFEISLRDTYAQSVARKKKQIDWVLPGQDWNFDQSILKVAVSRNSSKVNYRHCWHFEQCCRVIRNLNKNGIVCSLQKNEVTESWEVIFRKPHIILNGPIAIKFGDQLLGEASDLSIQFSRDYP